MTDKKQDMRPFSLVFGAFGLFIGITFSKMYDMMWYHVFTLAGIFAILAPFLFGQKETIVHTEEIKKKNLKWGVIVFILATIIVWITIENRFNLETMAKTKSL